MIAEDPASGPVVHVYNTDASNFTNHFAKLLRDSVCQLKPGTPKPGYTPTVEKFCRDRSVEDTMNEIFVESGTDLSAHHGLPIFSEMIHWLSRNVDLAIGDLDYTGSSEGFDAVVADDLRHAQADGLLHMTNSIS